MTKSELCPSTFPKPLVGFTKSLGGPLNLGWDFPKAWVEFFTTLGGVITKPGELDSSIRH